jgi:hypothetical protein
MSIDSSVKTAVWQEENIHNSMEEQENDSNQLL